jgi:UDP-N-acetylmuramoyl-tripeptide--D-alanyl-D-alanine ligase
MATPIPLNDAAFSLAGIMACTGGRVIGPLADDAMQVKGVSTDSRTLRPGGLFVALSGDNFDGHEHVVSAAENGAVLALVEREIEAPDSITLLRVSSALDALGKLAACHLTLWRKADPRRRVLALTGSAGKTTTKAAIDALLRAAQPHGVHTAPGNLNNLVGVPMTMFGLGEEHRYAVLELGTNRPGEIPTLAKMVRPDVGLLTLIASAHSAGLGDIDAIAREKTALFDEVDAVAIGNADDELVSRGLERCDAEQRRYGRSEQADYRISERELVLSELDRGLLRARLLIETSAGSMQVETPLLGHAGALATAGAIAAVEALTGQRIDASLVGHALECVGGRLAPINAPSGVLLIDDSYNSNPASCRSSLETASEVAAATGRRLVLVLGEMRELGEQSADEHDALGRLVASGPAALLIAVNGDALRIAERAREKGIESSFAEDAAAAAVVALRDVQKNDVVLVKGSRGVRTELVVQALMEAAL